MLNNCTQQYTIIQYASHKLLLFSANIWEGFDKEKHNTGFVRDVLLYRWKKTLKLYKNGQKVLHN